ncbi:MAG: helix-turn-helix domain-containing protein [Methylobacter sp.]
MPRVSSAIANTDYKNARSWLDFVGEIFEGLEERHDKVTHPFWIKRILELAEAWYYFKEEVVDKRKNGTKDQILALYAQGVTQAEISRKLSKSPARVSKIIKQTR